MKNGNRARSIGEVMAQPKLAMDLVEQRIAEHANLPKSSKPPPPMAVPLLQPLTRDGAPTSGRQPDANERARRAMQAEHFRHQVAMVLQESELFNEGDDAEDGCSDKNDNMATLTALDYGFEVELPRELDYAEAMEVLGEALAARVECSLKVFV